VSARVSPTDRIRGEIDALFDGSRDLSQIIEDVARLGARLIIQTAVEAEVDVFLGRVRYQRAADCPDARAGSRNGFGKSTVKTTAGPVGLSTQTGRLVWTYRFAGLIASVLVVCGRGGSRIGCRPRVGSGGVCFPAAHLSRSDSTEAWVRQP